MIVHDHVNLIAHQIDPSDVLVDVALCQKPNMVSGDVELPNR